MSPKGRSHWSSPLPPPLHPILNNLLFIYLVYTHNTHKYTHTQFSCTFFRFGAGAPGLGGGWGAPYGNWLPLGWVSYPHYHVLCCQTVSRGADLATGEPFPPRMPGLPSSSLSCLWCLPGLSAKSTTNCIAGVSCFG